MEAEKTEEAVLRSANLGGGLAVTISLATSSGSSAPTPVELTIYCLNGFQVRRGTNPILPRNWNRKKTAQLFKYLLVAEQPVPVNTLLEEFWPDLKEKAARHNLAVTLYNLRRTLEPERVRGAGSHFVVSLGDYIQLNWDRVAYYDVEKFLRERREGLNFLAQGMLRQAACAFAAAFDVYKTDFLTDTIEPWAVAKRQRLQTAYLDLLEHLTDTLIKLERHSQAFEYAGHLVQLDPCNEEGHRMLMEILMALGHRSQAIAQYHHCRDILKRERGISPGPLTEELYRRIASGESRQGSLR